MKLKEFIEKIKNFKKENEKERGIKIDIYVDERLKVDENEKEKKEKEIRINEFINKLNDYRIVKKMQRKVHDNFLYKEPIKMENLIVEKYESHNTSLNKRNKDEIKKKFSLKDTDKIYIQHSHKMSRRKIKSLFMDNKSLLTEIDY